MAGAGSVGLSDGSFLAKIHPSARHRDKDLEGIVMRVIESTHNDPERVGDGETHRLTTNLLARMRNE